MSEAEKRIHSKLNTDIEELDKLMEEYPKIIPNKKAAAFLNIDYESYIAWLETGILGMSWRKSGKANKAHITLTNQFARWYLLIRSLGNAGGEQV